MKPVLLFTDFGWRGPYIGQMITALERESPGTRVINLQSDAPESDPFHSAYLLAAVATRALSEAVWVCVVDPGVGGDRRPLIVEAGGLTLIGPDNGLLAPALRRLMDTAADVRVSIIDWRPERLSASFHGRDLFAPVAARITDGRPISRTSVEPTSLVGWDWPEDLWHIIYVDGFGNAMTGVRTESVDGTACLRVAGTRLHSARTFSDVPEGTAFWYRNSQGLVEIAVNKGRADHLLSLSVGTDVGCER